MKKKLIVGVALLACVALISVNTASAKHEVEVENEIEVENEVEVEHGVEVPENEVEMELEAERNANRPFRKFEGIWQLVSQPNLFLSLHDEKLDLIGIVIDINTFDSGYILGTHSGNLGHLTRSSNTDAFDADLVGVSKERATLTVNVCAPEATCILKEGVVDLMKVY
ncbi:MAG: hypothetical protein ACE5GQ_00900 [Nitrospinales bacterium]